jgi:4-azaleucine resistance transporter AzlC
MNAEKKNKVEFKEIIRGVKAAFPSTLPIFFGWIFVALTYGVLMEELGYGPLWTLLFSLICFCGGMQIAAVPMMAAGFDPVQMFIMSYFVNFRHTFYGLALLEKYNNAMPFKPFMIYTLADEPFSLAVSTEAPEGLEPRYFYFGQSLILWFYWGGLTAIGGLLGRIITFDTTGLDFALNALFIVFFLQQWKDKSNRPACLIGVAVTLAARIIFGSTTFLIPALMGLLVIFWLGRNKL